MTNSVTSDGASFHPASVSGRSGEKSSISARPKLKLAAITASHARSSCGPKKMTQATPARTTSAVAKSRLLSESPCLTASFLRLGVGAWVRSPNSSAISRRPGSARRRAPRG